MFENAVGKYLSIVHRAHTSLIDNIFQKEYDLSHGQVFILFSIFKNEGISQKKLCRYYKLDKSGVGRIIKKLEEKKLIMRKPDPDDRRKKLIYLTEKSENMKADFVGTLEQIEEKMRGDLTESQIDNVIDTLKIIHSNLDMEAENR